MIEIWKPAYNEEYRTLQFRRPDGRGQLGPDETVAACEVVCSQRTDGADTTADMVGDVAPYGQTQVRYRLKGGAAKSVYILEVRCTSSSGQKLAEKIILRVI